MHGSGPEARTLNVEPFRVKGDRLLSRLMRMAEIAATPRGGCNRQALTDVDVAGRNLPLRWAEEAGRSVRHELQRTGVQAGALLRRQGVKASFELHIEQRPVLDQVPRTIGVLTGVQPMNRHEFIVESREVHAGPAPMDMRRDPIRALADMLPAFYAIAGQYGDAARLTVGSTETLPGSPNTIPGRLCFTVNIRHPDAQLFKSLREEVSRLIQTAFERHALTGTIRTVWEVPGVSFDPTRVTAVRNAMAVLGLDSMDMISGAGHDSCYLSGGVPAAMAYIPCAGGLNHNEAEAATPSDLAAGASVLLQVMTSMALTAPFETPGMSGESPGQGTAWLRNRLTTQTAQGPGFRTGICADGRGMDSARKWAITQRRANRGKSQ